MNGRHRGFRVCVYLTRVGRGWGGFVEDRQWCYWLPTTYDTERAGIDAARAMVDAMSDDGVIVEAQARQL